VKKRDEFEPRVLELWVKTRVPMTRANIQYWTGAPRRKLERWLEQMVVDGVLDADLNRDGDMEWTVIGSARPIDAPATFAEHERREKIREEARRRVLARAAGKGETALVPARESKLEPKRGDDLDLPAGAMVLADKAKKALQTKKGDKSLLWSGGLSLLLGPVGWAYAGSWREALPAGLVYLAIAAIIPKMLLMPIAGVALPLSGIAGLLYAWQYNHNGKRTPLFLKDKDEDTGDG